MDPPVYDRLFQDFNRRQEAKKRLISIIDLKEKSDHQISLQMSRSSRSFRRSLSKPEVNSMVQRFNDYLQRKLLKIEKKRKEMAESQEIFFKEFIHSKKNCKTDPEAFKRLTAPKVLKKNEEVKIQKKTFSIKEAIESGKRLMKCQRKVVSETLSFTPSPVRMKRNLKEERLTISPKKESRLTVSKKNIEEVFRRCKNKAMLMSFIAKNPAQDNGKEILKDLEAFRCSFLKKQHQNGK
jgi:hypothetical protein